MKALRVSLVVFAVAVLIGWPAVDSLGEGPSKPQTAYKSPSDLAFSPDGKFLYVTNVTANSLSVIDAQAGSVAKEIAVGDTPTGVVVSPDGKIVFVANARSHSISFVEPAQGKVVAEVKCGYEPMGLCIAPDGKTLYSGNYISDDVSVIDVAKRKEVGRIKVGRAPMYLAITPDAKPMTVLLDNVNSGAAIPYGVALSNDGKTLYVTHRGIHQLSVIDLTKLHGLLATAGKAVTVPHFNLGFLWGKGGPIRRVDSGGLGPRGVAVSPTDGRIFVANYFSDVVAVLSPDATKVTARIPVGPPTSSSSRRGETCCW